mmetsp:Transcript_27014/g.67784  ORF Transcript_27014/g.67784 Transcript_27014/m.67784 type:complete len:336 (+) Transcript_27014:857-1864(+)
MHPRALSPGFSGSDFFTISSQQYLAALKTLAPETANDVFTILAASARLMVALGGVVSSNQDNAKLMPALDLLRYPLPLFQIVDASMDYYLKGDGSPNPPLLCLKSMIGLLGFLENTDEENAGEDVGVKDTMTETFAKAVIQRFPRVLEILKKSPDTHNQNSELYFGEIRVIALDFIGLCFKVGNVPMLAYLCREKIHEVLLKVFLERETNDVVHVSVINAVKNSLAHLKTEIFYSWLLQTCLVDIVLDRLDIKKASRSINYRLTVDSFAALLWKYQSRALTSDPVLKQRLGDEKFAALAATCRTAGEKAKKVYLIEKPKRVKLQMTDEEREQWLT